MALKHTTCGLIELKFAGGDGQDVGMKFSGLGAAFGNVDAYGDVIEPGAFSAWLADVKNGRQPWPAMLSQHGGFGMTAEDMTPIGAWTDLAENGDGLQITGQLADTPRGREIYTLMKMAPRPAIDGLSIGYIAKDWEPRSKPEDPRRRLKRVDVLEISPVTFPANRNARVDAVKRLEDCTTLAEVEDILRDAGGFSRAEAKLLVAKIKRSDPRDADTAAVDRLAAALVRNTHLLKGTHA